jgi:diadenosine tetraphosphatase ApaH/serine/threonine PP2A family protein phosphatase
MRLAVIADVHGNDLALKAVLEDIQAQGVVDIVNLGDSFSGPLNAGAVAEILLPLNLPTVRGNHDRCLIDRDAASMGDWERPAFDQMTEAQLDWIRQLPMTLELGPDIFMCHATPLDDNVMWMEEVLPEGRIARKGWEEIERLADGIACPVILCGHSHVPALLRISGGRMIVNPGSVGCPGFSYHLPYQHKLEAGHPLASYAILEKASAGWNVTFRNVAYDNLAMANLARANGDEEWAAVLTTGRL